MISVVYQAVKILFMDVEKLSVEPHSSAEVYL